jgi:GNAT superfamily N-acetyltransferase
MRGGANGAASASGPRTLRETLMARAGTILTWIFAAIAFSAL